MAEYSLPPEACPSDVAQIVHTISSNPHETLIKPNGGRLVDWDSITRVDDTPEVVDEELREVQEVQANLARDPLLRACRFFGRRAIGAREGSSPIGAEAPATTPIQRDSSEISLAGLNHRPRHALSPQIDKI